jgi:hypothetical protein
MELDWKAVKAALREVLEEEAGYGRYPLARKWEGGTMVLEPADSALKGKELPLDIFFKKIVAVREKLRVLEQKINNHPKLDHEDKLELQQLISRAYGSLTTFNVLFRDEDDNFVGQRD